MGSQTISILTEGVWASLTGGWYYDKKQSHFSNLFHLYIWLIFLCLPFVNFLFFNTLLAWSIYCVFIGLTFTVIKFVNAYFHQVFDTGKCIKDVEEEKEVEGEDSTKKTHQDFEMTILSNSHENSDFNNRSMGRTGESNAYDSIKGDEGGTRINLQADVHCNDSNHSSVINLSVLFGQNSIEEPDVISNESTQVKWGSNKSLVDTISNVETYLTNLKDVCFVKGNSSNNSIGLLDNIDYENKMLSTFRRARSELETIQNFDKYLKSTPDVPPSHPVSMEVINNNPSKPNEQEVNPLDTSRFNKETTSLDKIGTALDRGISNKADLKLAPGSTMSITNLEKIEESQEKPEPISNPSTYIKVCDSSEDGDESDVSLFNEGTSKPKISTSRKLSKQPMRKARPTSWKRKYSRSSDNAQRLPSESDSRRNKLRPKFTTLTVLSSSEEEDCKNIYEDNQYYYTRDFRGDFRRLPIRAESSLSSPNPSSSESRSSMQTADESQAAAKPSTSVEPHKKKQKKYKAITTAELKALGIRQHTNFGKVHSDTRCSTSYKNHRHPRGRAPDRADCARRQAYKSIDEWSIPSTSAGLPGSDMLTELLSSPNKHLASGHEDTSLGSVHVFQDERGNWFSYTFDENSAGVARTLTMVNPLYKIIHNQCEDLKPSSLIQSNSYFFMNNCTHLSDMTAVNNDPEKSVIKPDNNSNSSSRRNYYSTSYPTRYNSQRSSPFLELDPRRSFGTGRSFLMDLTNTSDFINSLNNTSFSNTRSQSQVKHTQYHEVNLCFIRKVKIRFDRLSLLAFLDRNLTKFELILSIFLAILVSVFSAILLHHRFFSELSLIIFCLVVASSQYTLLKSVQPDAASPTHGFNRITIYGRPVYFCLSSIIILLSHFYYVNYNQWHISFEVYGLDIFDREVAHYVFSISRMFLLNFPLLFSIGFMPQINTFVIYVCEQIDIHIFGGTASTMGMVSATYSLGRSLFLVTLLYIIALILNIKENNLNTPKASFSVFCGLMMAFSYHFSRLPSDPSLYWNAISSFFFFITSSFQRAISSMSGGSSQKNSQVDKQNVESSQNNILIDPLPKKLKHITLARIESDFLICIFITVLCFAVHVSSIFKLQPLLNNGTTVLATYCGLGLHYFYFHLRKQFPWLCFANPFCQSYEYKAFDVKQPARIMWFETTQAWWWMLEKNIFFPLVFLSFVTTDTQLLVESYGDKVGIFLLVLCGVKCFRSTFNNPSHNYIILVFTYLFFNYDFKYINGSNPNIFLLNYFVCSIVYHKVIDFLLKFRFVITYVAPWQITWGSAFHAFAQPFSVPHSGMLLIQLVISSILSSPLQPIFGSAIFFTSYVRPIKFWERDYNTKRVDHSNTRLAAQIDKAQIGSDDNNLNSIFYEHLTRSLQHSLYGDIVLGRWGDVSQGDCFVLASDNLNCLVHIIELGNGLVTFQVRGLEFRGTYCQQREVEAISESVSDDEGCCCCEPGHVRGMLSVNAAFNQRWLSWEVTQTNYVLEGYSISEHSATTILQPYDLRKALITFYVKSIIYYCITYQNLINWLENKELQDSLSYLSHKSFIDLDPTFNFNIDEDYDIMASGITRNSFKSTYYEWIAFCIEASPEVSEFTKNKDNEDAVISLCLGLSLLARRALFNAPHNNSSSMGVEFFLFGFHSLFKGDFRVHCTRDEWVFQNMDFLDKVIANSVRMALKLHQEQFAAYDELENNSALFEAITLFHKSVVISHEADPVWRNAILSNVPSLLSLRHVSEDGSDQYKVIMLNKRFLNFRVIKVNRECVRGLWAGQQQELIFLRNRNQERGSIQNAKQVLRNIINSSCDQPIGYPIYVSPLTTSFAESCVQLSQVIGPPISFSMFKRAIFGFFQKISTRCSEVCSSGSGGVNDIVYTGSRLTSVIKSESSDRDDNILGRGNVMSTHQQMTNYSLYLKKRAKQEKAVTDEEQVIPLVSLPLNRNVASIRTNSISASEGSASNTGPLPPGGTQSSKLTVVESSFVNIEQPNVTTPKGTADAV